MWELRAVVSIVLPDAAVCYQPLLGPSLGSQFVAWLGCLETNLAKQFAFFLTIFYCSSINPSVYSGLQILHKWKIIVCGALTWSRAVHLFMFGYQSTAS